MVGDYSALALIGETRILEDTDYLSFAGDFGFVETLPDSTTLNEYLVQEAGLLNKFSLSTVNLEFMLPGIMGRARDREIENEALRMLTGGGFDLVVRANNHALDFGYEGLSYNETALRNAGLATVGLREDPIYIWTTNGYKVGIYAVSDYTDNPDPQHAVLTTSDGDLALLKEQSITADFRVAIVHLGSMSAFPSPHEREVVSRVIKGTAADLVICPGTHFIKGYSMLDGKPVFWGTGDHLFSGGGAQGESVGMHVVVGLRSGILSQLFIVPFWNALFNGKVGPLDASEFIDFKNTFQARSAEDSDQYFTDPIVVERFKDLITNLSFSDLGNLRARHFSYAFGILISNYPIWTSVGVGLSAVLVLLFVRYLLIYRRRKHR